MWLELRTVQEGESPANPPAVLGLADGTVFPGFQLGIAGESVGEVIFNTSHFGYQEILTDPSYRHQIVVFTAPQIGNVGVNDDDAESNGMQPVGLVVRQASPIASNWRHRTTLQDYLESVGATAISGVDTRALTRHLRRTGAQAGCILTASAPGLERHRPRPRGRTASESLPCSGRAGSGGRCRSDADNALDGSGLCA